MCQILYCLLVSPSTLVTDTFSVASLQLAFFKRDFLPFSVALRLKYEQLKCSLTSKLQSDQL